mgnify:CR=1 FL=1
MCEHCDAAIEEAATRISTSTLVLDPETGAFWFEPTKEEVTAGDQDDVR